MNLNSQTVISKDPGNKKLKVIRDFDASPDLVWKAWTESELLDQWWAPKPWKAVTKQMDFRPGGAWLYFMQGPEGEKVWCRSDFLEIDQGKSFSVDEMFSDENGVPSREMPVMHWNTIFMPTATGTTVEVEITFDSEEDLNKILEMGFEEGFTAAHVNLDELLKKTLAAEIK